PMCSFLLSLSPAPLLLPSFPTRRSADLALIVALAEVPLFGVVVLGRSPTAAALMLVRFTALIPVGALLGGVIASRLSPALVGARSEEHTSELQSRGHLVCRLLLEKKITD